MAQLDMIVHQYKMHKGQPQLVKVVPYVRLSNGSEVIYLQGGKYFWAGGEEAKAKDIPAWVKEQVADLADVAKREVGLAS